MTSQYIGRKLDYNIKFNHGKYKKQAAETYKNILITLHKTDATCTFKGNKMMWREHYKKKIIINILVFVNWLEV